MYALNAEGRAYYYTEAGAGGPAALLLHDRGESHRTLTPLFEHLRRQRRTVTVDLLNHGASDRVDGRPSVAALADDLVWICGELGVYRPVVIGAGLGGLVALAMANRRPDRVGASVVMGLPASEEAATLLSSGDLPVCCIDSPLPGAGASGFPSQPGRLTAVTTPSCVRRSYLDTPDEVIPLIEDFIAGLRSPELTAAR